MPQIAKRDSILITAEQEFAVISDDGVGARVEGALPRAFWSRGFSSNPGSDLLGAFLRGRGRDSLL